MAKKRDIQGNRLYHFELSDKNRTVRWILIAILLAVGAVAVIAGLISALVTPSGWQTVEASSTKLTCSHAFAFQYDLGAGEKSASAESKELSLYYGDLAEKAWGLFYNESANVEIKGLYYLNAHPNETVEVDEGLYNALSKFQKAGNRSLFLAPVYAAYDQVFHADDVTIAQDRDPGQNADTAQYVAELIAFVNDPQAVNLELLGDHQVKLTVGESYLQYAKDNEIRFFVDFGWMKNAAAIDYMAEAFKNAGYTNGYLTSIDGYLRNLDTRGTTYNFNVYRKGETGGQLTALMEYTDSVSMVMMRNYPLYRDEMDRFYTFENGRTVTTLIDPADGVCKAATDTLVSYGKDKSCLEMALKVMPLYITEAFSEDGVNALTAEGVYSVWFTGKEIRYNQPDLSIETQDENYTPVAVTR